VTESILAHVTLHKNNVLDRLQQLGVKIASDDFGTQYSSLDYLKTYRVSRVKIPRLMIDEATQDRATSAMVRAIIRLARELDIRVVAQGVETEVQRDLLTCVSLRRCKAFITVRRSPLSMRRRCCGKS
jgi:EAL domain-containing protein (putative c-di-GMP-specific phosphodiesterase class I)